MMTMTTKILMQICTGGCNCFPKNVHLFLRLTLGSVKDTSEITGLEKFGTVPCEKLDLRPHSIKLNDFALKSTTSIKIFSSDETHVNM